MQVRLRQFKGLYQVFCAVFVFDEMRCLQVRPVRVFICIDFRYREVCVGLFFRKQHIASARQAQHARMFQFPHLLQLYCFAVVLHQWPVLPAAPVGFIPGRVRFG